MRRDAVALVAIGLGALGIFALLGRRVAGRGGTPRDLAVRRKVQRRRKPVTDGVAFALTMPGYPIVYMPAAMLAARELRTRGAAGGVPVIASAIVAFAAHHAVKHFLVRVRPPSNAKRRNHREAYPSGHTTPVTAIALTAAHVLHREGLAARALTVPLALAVPVIVGATRVYLDRHWLTDVVGAWTLGAAVAAASAGWYEVERSRD